MLIKNFYINFVEKLAPFILLNRIRYYFMEA